MPPFTDIGHLPTEAQDAIEWCRTAGITNGITAEWFAPDGAVTRWQMALFLYRIGIQLGMVEPKRTLAPEDD